MSHAAAQTKMIVTPTQEGTATEYALKDVRTLTFGFDNFIVTDWSANTNSFLFDNVRSIKFKDVTTSIENVTTPEAKLRIACNDNLVCVYGWPQDQVARMSIYNTSGQQVVFLPQWSGASIDMSASPAGIYLIKINNKTYKFLKRR